MLKLCNKGHKLNKFNHRYDDFKCLSKKTGEVRIYKVLVCKPCENARRQALRYKRKLIASADIVQ